jgi:hypothetical protein
MHTKFWSGNMKKRDNVEDLCVSREIGWEGVAWVHLAQDMDQWQALVNTVMKLWVP